MTPETYPNDTREGIQQCIDVLHDRRSELNAQFNEAAKRQDGDTMNTLSIRLEELAALMWAIRIKLRGVQ